MMNKEEDLPPPVKYWLSPDAKHDCYFIVGSESGPTERIGAFKAFLIGYSEPLRAMLQDSELAEQGDISIVDVTPDTFKVLLKCLYMSLTDTIIKNLSFQKCCDLLYIAEKYIVTLLKEKLIKQCHNTMSSDVNCITAACSSEVFMQEECLEKKLSVIVRNNIKSIISSAQFFQMTDDTLVWILEIDSLDIDELSMWQAVLKWAKTKTNSNDGNVIRTFTLKLLKYIRFCSMNFQDFCKHVVPSDILTGTEVKQICKYYGIKEIPNMEFICNEVASRCHVDDLKPQEVTFSYRVDSLSSSTSYKSDKFKFLNLMWHLLIQRRIQRRNNNEFELFLVREGSMHDPSWKYRVKVTLTLTKGVRCHNDHCFCLNHPWDCVVDPLANDQQHNSSFSFPFRTYCSEEPSNGLTKFLLCSANINSSGRLTNRSSQDGIIVMVTIREKIIS